MSYPPRNARLASASAWLHRFPTGDQITARLFCVPFAGGSAHAFADWARELTPGVELLAVQLPGRGARIAEAPVSNQNQLLDAVFEALLPLTDLPYFLFGHSMGGRIAYELSSRLRDGGHRLPEALVVSATRPPHLPRTASAIHDLPCDEFYAQLRALGGMSSEVLQSPELLELLEPALRADFRLVETWVPMGHAPLPIPIHAVGGSGDAYVGARDLDQWSSYTSRDFSLNLFDGDHFYLNKNSDIFFDWLREILTQKSVMTDRAADFFGVSADTLSVSSR